MRIKALILVFPLAVFLIETASFVPAMKDACTLVANAKPAKRSSCCMKKEKEKPAQDQCNNKKKDNNKSSGNDCTDNPDCTTCPVCYTFIFQPQYEWPAEQLFLKKDYSLLNTNYTSSYTTDVWKPPNGFVYSS